MRRGDRAVRAGHHERGIRLLDTDVSSFSIPFGALPRPALLLGIDSPLDASRRWVSAGGAAIARNSASSLGAF